MPQLDFSVYSPQIIWLVITFLILWLLMAKVALPRIGLVLEERQKKINDNLEMAKIMRKEGTAELEAYEKAILEARENARAVISEMTQQITQDSATQTADLRDTLAKRLEEAEIQIASAKQRAIEQIHFSAGEIATATTKKLVGESVLEEKVNAAVESAIKNGVS